MQYETVIGLEVHVELSTQTKIFCGCTTRFGGDPNTHCCPVCLGLPGTLPVLNEKVVEYAVRAGLALNCDITRYSKFDRKNYFYPDLPKAYQVSQLYLPICQNGSVQLDVNGRSKTIRIREIHMEEDAGKLMHDPWEDLTLVDYNRGGTPLLEIVSQPDFRTADEVLAYLEQLRATLQYMDVSDCKMQEGSMRADINLSVRPAGSKELGTRTEMKNMNSFKSIARAVQSEARRQIELLEEGKPVIQQTRRWDDNKDASFAMRSKEDAHDYRYFPEPDLPPIHLSEAYIRQVADTLPERPEQKRLRYQRELGLSEYDTRMITASKAMADFFEATLALCGDAKEAANWIMGDVFRMLKETETEPEQLRLTPRQLSEVIVLIRDGRINRSVAREVFEAAFNDGVAPAAYVRQHGLEMVSDEGAVLEVVKAVLAENQKVVADYRGGKQKAFTALVGQCMKRLKGKADPALVNSQLKQLLGE